MMLRHGAPLWQQDRECIIFKMIYKVTGSVSMQHVTVTVFISFTFLQLLQT